MKVLSIVGHKQKRLNLYDQEILNKYIENSIDEYNPDEILTSLISGADFKLADYAYENGIPYSVRVPYLDFTRNLDSQTKTHYKQIFKKANKVTTSSKRFTPSLMKKHHDKMIADSTAVIFIWDGSPGIVKSLLFDNLKKDNFFSVFNLLDNQVYKNNT